MIEPEIRQTIEHIANRWDGVDRKLLVPLFHLLAEGRPVPLQALVVSERHSLTEVQGQLLLAGADFDEAGCVVGLGGISLVGGSHSVALGDTFLFTCCAITAHTVPILIGRPVILQSLDPVSKQNVSLSVSPDTVTTTVPADTVATFVPLDEPQKLPGLSERFCNYVRYFENSTTANACDLGNRPVLLLSPDKIHEAARLWVQLVWGMTL